MQIFWGNLFIFDNFYSYHLHISNIFTTFAADLEFDIGDTATMTAQQALQKYFGYDDFRPLQAEIIDSVLAGRDTLALMPTGGGKSLCFQIPTLVMADAAGEDGCLCLVITPLIALMKDQVENLRQRGIRAAAIYTGMTQDQQHVALDNCQFGPYRFLYVSPERLESEEFRKRLAMLPIRLIAVDEAHCISQWGYDFRPSYLRIGNLTLSLSSRDGTRPAILALTATATPEVVEDICDKLQGEEQGFTVFKKSFARSNLQYIVRYCEDTKDTNDPKNKFYQLRHILSHVQGSAIVYVRNRKRAVELSEALTQSLCEPVEFYHAGLTTAERTQKQNTWKNGSVRIIVCTNAFGMGIDKPDVRVVIHHDLPDSMEAYFQEAGRAGRDEQTAYAVLLYAPSDKTKARRRVADNYPTPEFVEAVYHKTCDYLGVGLGSGLGHSFALHMDDLCQVRQLPMLPTYSALNLLSQAGYIHFEEERELSARVRINVPPQAMYEYHFSEAQEAMLNDLLRHYAGITTDLQYIPDEKVNHEVLASLAARGVLTYIPRTRACGFTFTMERQDSIYLKKSVYQDRRALYADKLRAMVEYAEQTQFCRSQLLLSYFGENDSQTCKTCDVCRAKA